MARIWLDATVDEEELNASSWRRPPVPSIPEAEEQQSTLPSQLATAPHTPTIPSRRRRSMPPRPASHLTPQDASSRRKGASTSRRSPLRAEDDVISSLVASLAHDPVASSPSQHGEPSRRLESPALRKMRSQETGLGDSHSIHASNTDFDNAAIPPVIKTAPPPSGFSPITAPKAAKSSPVRSSFFRMNSKTGSRTSVVSQQSADDARSGAFTVDSISSGPPGSGAEAIPLDIPRVDNRQRELKVKSSYEQMKDLVAEQRRALSNMDIDDVQYLYPPSPHKQSESPRKKHDSSIDNPEFAFAKFDSIPGLKAYGKRPAKDDETYRDVSLAVPIRQSSLSRHDGSSVGSGNRRRSTKTGAMSSRSASNQSDTRKTTIPGSDSGRPSDELRFEDVEDIDTDVVKRIKELKARRELRRAKEDDSLTFLSMQFSSLTGSSPGSLSRSRSPSARHMRSASDPEKDEKMLATKSPTLHKAPSTNDLLGSNAHFDHGLLGDTKIPGTPPSPPGTNASLPIDYSYVLQALEEDSKSRRISKISADSRSVHNTTTTPGQLENKGRGAIDMFETASRNSDARTGARANSDELPIERFKTLDDLVAEITPSSSKTKKKKRWSQSDIPLPEKADSKKSHKRNRNSDSLAVQPPDLPAALSEGRPSTSDSVDNDVNRFVHAGRLTQKIRHPQTGRTIAFSEVGDPQGHAVFCCVGMGLTRYITAFYDELAMTLKLRLITPDRPGVGETQSDPSGTPLSWPDDVVAICQALRITKFSIMAHSAGAVYALATALRVPQHIRRKVHLLAPWIPPSQMTSIGLKEGLPPTTQLPKSQRLLRALPTPFLKVANSGFMNATSASLSPNNSPKQRKRNNYKQAANPDNSVNSHSRNESLAPPVRPNLGHAHRDSIMLMDQNEMPSESALSLQHKPTSRAAGPELVAATTLAEQERRKEYDSRLTLAIWDVATRNANPAVDLLVCLERTQPIGFRYVDINRSVVIHHGNKDTRVPVENVKWLGKTMRKCEVRILEGEGHGLMASAKVMGEVLTEMAKEWQEWTKHTTQKGHEKLTDKRGMLVGAAGINGSGSSSLALATPV